MEATQMNGDIRAAVYEELITDPRIDANDIVSPPKTPWLAWAGCSASPMRSMSRAAHKWPLERPPQQGGPSITLRSRVATQPYKITFKDGSTRTLPRVWRHYRDGPFLVFQDEDTEVLRVSAADVSSVVPTELPDEERT